MLAAEQLVINQQGGETSGHDDAHVYRVVKMAHKIAKSTKEPVDRFLLELVCWLHDIDDPKLEKRNEHISVTTFLKDHQVDTNLSDTIQSIIACLSYTATKKGLKETAIEGKIAQDADRLDALGAIGIARAFAYGGSKGRLLVKNGPVKDDTRSHFDDKLFKLESLMNTEYGKKLAAKRTRFMHRFIALFDLESQ